MMLRMLTVAVFGTFLMSVLVSAGVDFDLLLWSKAVTGQSYVLVGGDLQLDCTLDEYYLKNYTAHNVSFKFQFRGLGDAVCVPASNVKVVSNEVARLLIQNVSLQDAGPYACYVGYTPCTDDSTIDTVGLSDDVKVEYPPHNVTNFNCVVYNWDSLMSCTWEHPVVYQNASNIEVTTLTDPQRDDSKCPDQQPNFCKWTQQQFYLSMSFRAYVTVRNIITNTTATSSWDVDPYKLVKPDPVGNLAFSIPVERPDCIDLSWSDSKPRRFKAYRVKHSNKKDKIFTVLVGNLTSKNWTACGYPPYTWHNFSVECYPTQDISGFWSDPEYVFARTPMTAPSQGPRITRGSFTTSPCERGVRNVTVMWQEMDESAKNGIIDSYLIKVDGRELITVFKDAYSATIKLPCYSPSEIMIFAHNEGGYSLNPSLLTIPSVDFSVPRIVQDSFSVEIISNQSLNGSQESLRATWEVDAEAASVNYTVFWCKGLPGRSCMGEIYWSHVAETQASYNIPIEISEAGTHLYGISVTDTLTGLATELVWTGCLFSHKLSIGETVKRLELNSGENKVQVSWAQIPCTYQSMVKVTNYMVKWCQSNRCNNTGEIFNYSVPAKSYLYTVSELTANVKYSFTVQPLSYEGIGAEVKPWKDAVPVSGEKSTKLLSVLVGIFVSLLLFPLAALIYWRCNKAKIKTNKLKSKEFLKLDNAVPRGTGNQTTEVVFSPENGNIRLLKWSNSSSPNCSDSEGNFITMSPGRTTTSSDLCDSHLQDEATIPGSASSNPESIKSYQECAYSLLKPTSENSNSRSEQCAVHVDSTSAQSYQQFACSQSSNGQVDLVVLPEKDDVKEQTSLSILGHSQILETPISDTHRVLAESGLTSPVLNHVSVTLNADLTPGTGSTVDVTPGTGSTADAPPENSLLDLDDDSASETDEGNYQPFANPEGEDTSSPPHNDTSNCSSSSATNSSPQHYSQFSMFLGQSTTESDHS